MGALARFRLVSSPPGGQAAIGVIEVVASGGAELEAALAAAGVGAVGVGQWGVRRLGEGRDADRGVVARVDARTAWLMPHAGPAVVLEVLHGLARAGLAPLDEPTYAEAASEVEARMLGVLARAASPLAVDLLLDQPQRWAGLDPRRVIAEADERERRRWEVLRRLVEPALVVSWGAPNIGKSSVLNALAATTVALAADERGTTRDHVGATLDLGGLVVWYADTPGVDEGTDAAHAEAQGAAAAARELASRADLLVLCGDATSGFVEPPPVAGGRRREELRVGLRSDLGPVRGGAAVDVAVSVVGSGGSGGAGGAGGGEGVRALAGAIRERLVPAAAMGDPRAWVFWDPGDGPNGARSAEPSA
jgi:hypothetical protein